MVLATVLVGCSTSNHKGVMGSKGRSSKSFAKRHHSREYQEAKVKDKKTEVVLKENQTNDTKGISSPVPAPSIPAATSTINAVAEQKVQHDAVATASQTTNTNEGNTGEQTSIIHHEIDPAFGLNSTTESSPLINLPNNTSSENAFEPRLFPSATETVAATKQTAKKQTNKTEGTIITVKAAEQKESKHHLVLYFAFAQAFIALMLGLKQVFGMLDTPSDAGNKAISMSYATMGILSIHALLLIAVAKSFLS